LCHCILIHKNVSNPLLVDLNIINPLLTSERPALQKPTCLIAWVPVKQLRAKVDALIPSPLAEAADRPEEWIDILPWVNHAPHHDVNQPKEFQ